MDALSGTKKRPWGAEGAYFYSGTGAPSAGTFMAGEWIFNMEPSAGGVAAWVCITAGTPGTWVTIAAAS